MNADRITGRAETVRESHEFAHVALVGLMGSGKSTVGRRLATLLGWPMVDNDAMIEHEHGATVRELGERLGVERMHELEAEQLLRALDQPQRSVVCAAASTIEDRRCREALKRADVFTAWLDVDPRTLAQRFPGGSHRPLLAASPLEMFEQEELARGPLYTEVADQRIGGPQDDATAVAREIWLAICEVRRPPVEDTQLSLKGRTGPPPATPRSR